MSNQTMSYFCIYGHQHIMCRSGSLNGGCYKRAKILYTAPIPIDHITSIAFGNTIFELNVDLDDVIRKLGTGYYRNKKWDEILTFDFTLPEGTEFILDDGIPRFSKGPLQCRLTRGDLITIPKNSILYFNVARSGMRTDDDILAIFGNIYIPKKT